MEMTFNPDKAGAATAILCGIHCLLMPVVVVALPSLHISESWEWVFFSASITMALWSSLSTFRHDREVWPAIAMVTGLSILLSPHVLGLAESIHPITAVIGAGILISTHVRNLRVHARHH